MKITRIVALLVGLHASLFAQYERFYPLTKDQLKKINVTLPSKKFLGMGTLTLKKKTAADVIGDKEFYFETKTPQEGALDQLPEYWKQDGDLKKYSVVLFPVALKKGVEYRYGVIVGQETGVEFDATGVKKTNKYYIIQSTKIARSQDLQSFNSDQIAYFDEATFNAMNTSNK
ncbi:MAG TPA: hypothetical protein VFF04_04130 [Candidatus Babeliales bacterium]|nr:hypothetical protein [Candidatus Babeliales bacterium]